MRRSGVLFAFTFLLVALVGVLAIFWTAPDENETMGWRAYDLLIVPKTEDLLAVHRSLRAAGLDPLDATNATVHIEDFNGQSAVPITEIPERFVSADPRIDPFVAASADLFTVVHNEEEYSVVYLPRGDDPVLEPDWRRTRLVRRAMEGITFYFAGRHPITRIAAAGAVAAILCGLVVLLRRRVVLSVAMTISAIGYVLVFGVTVALPATITTVVAIYATLQTGTIEREWLIHRGPIDLDHGQKVLIATLAGGVGISVLSTMLNPEIAPGVGIAGYLGFLGTIAGWYGVAIVFTRNKVQKSEHRLFSPRPILGDHWRPRPTGADLFPGLAAVAVFATIGLGYLFFVGVPGGGDDSIYAPAPQHRLVEPGPIATPEDGVQLLRAVSSIDPIRNPLSVAGFIAHRRFQDSLLFGGEYSVPEVGESVLLRRFRRNGGVIEAWEEEQLRFDGEWVVETYSVPADTVYALFSTEGGVFSIGREQIFSAGIPRGYVQTQVLLLFLFVLPLLLPIRLPYRDGLGTVAIASRSERR